MAERNDSNEAAAENSVPGARNEFAGMTIEQVQREMRKRRANDESQREHIALFQGVAAHAGEPENDAQAAPGWTQRQAEAPSEIDESAAAHRPRLELPSDSGLREPVKLFHGSGARPNTAASPGSAAGTSSSGAPSAVGYPFPTGQSASPQPAYPAHQPLNPPVAPPMNWSPAPAALPVAESSERVQTPAQARQALYGASDDPFVDLPEHRRSSPEAFETAKKIIVWGGIALIVVLAAWLVYALVPMPVQAPTSYTTYISPDQQYRISAPSGWSIAISTSKSSNIPNNDTQFRDGPAKIDIDLVSAQMSAMNTIMSSAYYTGRIGDPLGPMHQTTQWRGSYTHQRYSEKQPVAVATNYGPMDCSEFMGAGGLFGWGGEMHGYRATVYGNGVAILVLAECPASDWSSLQPAFMKVLESIGPADGSVYSPDSSSDDSSPGASSAAPNPYTPQQPSAYENNGGGQNGAGNGYGQDGYGHRRSDGTDYSNGQVPDTDPGGGVPSSVHIPPAGDM